MISVKSIFWLLLIAVFSIPVVAESRLDRTNRRIGLIHNGLFDLIGQFHRSGTTSDDPIKLSDHFKIKVSKIARGNVSSPKISGDGKTIVWNQFFPDESLTSVMRFRDGKTERLSSPVYGAMWPSISHDGNVVVWTSTPRGYKTDWDIERWENGQTRVMAGSKLNEFYHEVSADGKTIVFDRDENGSMMVFDVFVIRNGAEGYPEPVATIKGKDECIPFVSADGSLLFWREFRRLGDKVVQDIYRLEEGKRVPTIVDDFSKYQPAIDEKANRMVFVYNKVDRGGIYTMDRLDPKTITDLAETEDSLQWSPAISRSGTIISWTDQLNTERGFNVWIHRAGKDAPLTLNEDRLYALPSLSADGNALVFVDFTDKDDYHLYRIDFLD